MLTKVQDQFSLSIYKKVYNISDVDNAKKKKNAKPAFRKTIKKGGYNHDIQTTYLFTDLGFGKCF